MLILSVPWIIIAIFIISLLFLYRKKWVAGLSLLVVSLIFNWWGGSASLYVCSLWPMLIQTKQ